MRVTEYDSVNSPNLWMTVSKDAYRYAKKHHLANAFGNNVYDNMMPGLI